MIGEWDALARSTGASFFQTGTWVLSWWKHLVGEPESVVGAWRDPDGSLAAIASLARVRRPILRGSGPAVEVWVNAGSGAGAGDHLGWPGKEELRASMLAWAIEVTSGPFEMANAAAGWSIELSTAGLKLRTTQATLRVPLEGDEWFAGSNDFRKKLRYYRRKLEQAGVGFTVIDGEPIPDPVFDRLLELHSVRSENMGWDSSFDKGRRRFHRALSDGASAGEGPVAVVASRGDDVVGVLYAFRFGSTFAYYQTGWSQDYVRESLGSVLVLEAMEYARSTGATLFDFLRGDDPYKRRFGAVEAHDETWGLDRGIGSLVVGVRDRAAKVAKAVRSKR
jgi:CelD/BcsL family acetyltransferase involved in cellulose biosynthesis